LSLIYHEHKSGLIVAEHGGDEVRLSRALRDQDRDLILTKEVDERYGCFVWKVLLRQGDDRPALHVLDWRDVSGKPLPLTGRIVDEVDAQRKDRPGGYDALKASDDANARLVASRRKEFEDGVADIESEFSAQLERGRKQVSFGGETKLPAWQRNKHLPGPARRSLR
jgi:hypothetical protein